jgi:hypothetical protein
VVLRAGAAFRRIRKLVSLPFGFLRPEPRGAPPRRSIVVPVTRPAGVEGLGASSMSDMDDLIYFFLISVCPPVCAHDSIQHYRAQRKTSC